MRQFGFAAIVVGLLAVSASGQEAVTIKISRVKSGDRVKITKTETDSESTTFGVAGKEEAKSENKSKSMVYVDEIIVAAEKKGPAIKLIRTYEKYENSTPEPGMSAPPLKVAIQIEKKDNKYTYTVDGKPVEKEVAALLDTEFMKPISDVDDEDLLPKGPIKPGETWKPNTAKLLKDLAGDGKLLTDEEKSTIVCKLVSATKKNDKQYGVIELKVDLAVKAIGGKKEILIKSGKMTFTMTGNVCLDGTDPSETSTDEMSFVMEAVVNDIPFKFVAKGTKKETRELLPKK
ncbi:MAG: hypothetical protein K8U57_01250 [Planctomycetes bacterium]|nr:hypothetical protein [Planctomycetota bacterium]